MTKNINSSPNLEGFHSFLMPTRTEPETKKLFMGHSICSLHRSFNDSCNLCNQGSWVEIEYVSEDAERYRKLRKIALEKHDLEATVALGQLDFIQDEEGFDACVEGL